MCGKWRHKNPGQRTKSVGGKLHRLGVKMYVYTENLAVYVERADHVTDRYCSAYC